MIDNENEMNQLSLRITDELTDFFIKYKRSKKVLKYKEDGTAMLSILYRGLQHFVIREILDISLTAKIRGSKGEELSKGDRFGLLTNRFLETFAELANTYLSLIEKKPNE